MLYLVESSIVMTTHMICVCQTNHNKTNFENLSFIKCNFKNTQFSKFFKDQSMVN